MIRHRRSGVAAAVALVTLAACADANDGGDRGAGDGTGPSLVATTTAPPTTPTTLSPTTSAPSPPVTAPPETEGTDTTTAPPTTPATSTTVSPTTVATMGDPEVRVTEVARLDQPVNLAHRAGDATLYVVEQPGRIVALDPDDGGTRTVADLTDRTAARGERGLLGLAFSPTGDLAYTNHTDVDTGATVVTEHPVDPDGTFDVAAGRVLLEIAQPYGNHNGGHLVFGPDDNLYIGTGDGGSGGDPQRNALDLGSLLGKLLRIDPTPSGGAPYTIPPDNPYLGVDGARPELFAIGLRNPWKFAFDPVTGDLWIADVGQNRLEEVNHVPAPGDGTVAGAGLSFGWSAFEATDRFNDDVDPDGHTPPVLEYDHSGGECSVSGGAPYRGAAIPELVGGYVYGDFCSGRIWALDLAGGRNLELGRLSSVTAVLPGPDGELYVLSAEGPIHRIDPA